MIIKATKKIEVGSYKYKKGDEISMEVFQALPFKDGQENCEFVSDSPELKTAEPKEVKEEKSKPESK